ncbi:dihydroxyacetone kinase subunit DhaL [Marinitenerispora sediminis]|uniref:Dihydroxyacetone kinase subunit L n=1 Tax=Marinitenerispora sediminis TaxID=1931232 RepID=A0A368T2L9_9ACTN|nr:dihydroxyacetone kinase subunit DhaL [Marinitenerispora sediminis]RCV48081.1 dihydroxyacetone kinase subunit L [Marinitenerispora sediminis]RCV51889.1 dihydroxyacetone kinase subunit L [Marinitenerispora sediminis]RCV55658.1 dihydroxyacetone kinase subunit L [Marinitenerispora sediminis]
METDLARAWLRAAAAAIEVNRDHLTRLDSAIGDADHGTNMHRGFTAVLQALDGYPAATAGDVLIRAGGTLISRVGGASGPLYGTALRTAGKRLTGERPDPAGLAAALADGLAAVCRLGSAQVGDKTMVDAFAPAVDALRASADAGEDLGTAARAAAEAAEAGLRATAPLQARRGRASYLGERSIGHEDPGAASTALLFRALADAAARPAG